MSDRNIIPTAPGVMSIVRLAMRCSPVHRVDDSIPERIGELLAELVLAEDRHRERIRAFRAKFA